MNRYFKTSLVTFLVFSSYINGLGQHALLEQQHWIHGSANCQTNQDSLIQVVRYNENTWILRQNKCIHYEAPFMFLFIGQAKAMLVDTGATEDEAKFPLYRTVRNILLQFETKSTGSLPLLVVHSHGHHDHWAGDGQFRGKSNVVVTGLTLEDVKDIYGIKHWPEDQGKIDLGNRVLDIIPTPGHDASSIAFYDRSTKLLLTGDTFYPGRLYVRDWEAFRKSIARLLEFTRQHEISYILGNHIEMSTTPGVDYPTGSTFHPHEQALPLTIPDLQSLNIALEKLGDKPRRAVHDKFIIEPK